MTKIYIFLLLLSSSWLTAQHETLFDDFDIRGAFGGPILEIGNIAGEAGADVGGGGALLINNFFLGGYGMGTSYPDVRLDNTNYNIRFRHGGLWLGFTMREHKLAHLYSSVKVGWGRAQLRRDGETDFSDRHFVLTPELGLEINVFDWFKLGLTGGYRWVNGINNLPGLTSADFSSPVGILTFRFGGFDSDNDWDWDD
jgi:hypothetical protein